MGDIVQKKRSGGFNHNPEFHGPGQGLVAGSARVAALPAVETQGLEGARQMTSCKIAG